MKELKLKAVLENLPKVTQFIDEQLESKGCNPAIQIQMDVAVEEMFVNIASYAYTPDTGMATICVDISDDEAVVKIKFIDSGVPYNPLAKQDPDITKPVEEREIGGLGIFMVKKSMDDMEYEYKDGQNILTITKRMK